MKAKIAHKTFSFLVDNPSQSYNKKYDLDKNVRVVLGLLISTDNPKLLYLRGSQRIEISGEEIYAEDYESKLLTSGSEVAPNDKYYILDNEALSGNGEVKMLYKDTENALAPFVPYKVSLVLKCELK